MMQGPTNYLKVLHCYTKASSNYSCIFNVQIGIFA